MTDGRPQTVSELYPSKWLKAADLGGRAVVVKIVAVDVEEFRQRDGSKKLAAVLTFERARKRMILNKTQCGQMVTITGSERFADWVGHTVMLAPAVAHNGKATIAIRKAPPGDGKAVYGASKAEEVEPAP
ncbi:MAG TPA: hypothetical protein G4O02_06710 [Caldilineae bacterium]|jgi:hypothetical protein|nr:hypothetical protein [Caldilineae bacterium]